MKKRYYLSIILFLAGLYLIDPKITGAVIGTLPHTLTSTIGIILILISGVISVTKGLEEKKDLLSIMQEEDPKLRDKTKIMRKLKRYIDTFEGNPFDLIGDIVDTLAHVYPTSGSSKRELRNIANTLAAKYGLDRTQIYRDISEGLHEEKRSYGRKGR